MHDDKHPALDDNGKRFTQRTMAKKKKNNKKHPVLDDYGKIKSHPETDDKKHPTMDANCIK